MNEFLEWANRNARVLAAGAAGLLVLSVLVGFLLGRAQRVERASSVPRGGTEVRKTAGPRGNTVETEGANPRLLPPPIVPVATGENAYSFVLDRADAFLADMEPVPLKISELLSNRAADVEPDFTPFVLDNEEFDVLIRTKVLAEP